MTPVFMEGMQKANTVLLEHPEAIALDLVGGAFIWLNTSAATKKARKELREVLTETYQSGAFNYEQFAKGLRIDTQTVQALMDEEFIDKHSL